MADPVIGKQLAARCQIDTAVRMLFIHDEDILAIHTVAAAARSILQPLAEARDVGDTRSIQSVLEEIFQKEHGVEEISPMIAGQIADRARAIEKAPATKAMRNRVANFLKHADRDPDQHLSLEDVDVCWVIMHSIMLWTNMNLEVTPEMWAYLTWWIIATGEGSEEFRFFTNIEPFHELNFDQQTRLGRHLLEHAYRENIGTRGVKLQGGGAHRPSVQAPRMV